MSTTAGALIFYLRIGVGNCRSIPVGLANVLGDEATRLQTDIALSRRMDVKFPIGSQK